MVKILYRFMYTTWYSCKILMKLESSQQIFEKYSSTKFNEYPCSGSRVIRCGERDRQVEAGSKVKLSHYRPGRALRIPAGWGHQISRQKTHDGCQPYSTAAFTPQELFLVLISVRGWVHPRAIMWPEGLCQWKITVPPSGIQPATFRLVAQCLNQVRNRVVFSTPLE
jgi:hypothetical protein